MIKTEQEIRDLIAKVVADNFHVLDCYPATVGINAPRALMQLAATAALDQLHWVLGEKRSEFKCDDYNKKDN